MTARAVLAIDIANPTERDDAPAPAVALGVIEQDRVRTLGALPIDHDTRRSDGVLALIARLYEAHDLAPADTARVVVTVGPGGYTATRVGVTAGVTLAHACHAALVGVPCWRSAWWGRDHANDRDGVTLIALAGKRDSAHLSIVEAGEPRPLGVRTAGAVGALDPTRVIAGRHLPASFEDAFASAGVVPERVRVGADVLLAHALEPSPAGDPAEVRPVYAREPDAVTQWRALHPGAFSDAEPA